MNKRFKLQCFAMMLFFASISGLKAQTWEFTSGIENWNWSQANCAISQSSGSLVISSDGAGNASFGVYDQDVPATSINSIILSLKNQSNAPYFVMYVVVLKPDGSGGFTESWEYLDFNITPNSSSYQTYLINLSAKIPSFSHTWKIKGMRIDAVSQTNTSVLAFDYIKLTADTEIPATPNDQWYFTSGIENWDWSQANCAISQTSGSLVISASADGNAQFGITDLNLPATNVNYLAFNLKNQSNAPYFVMYVIALIPDGSGGYTESWKYLDFSITPNSSSYQTYVINLSDKIAGFDHAWKIKGMRIEAVSQTATSVISFDFIKFSNTITVENTTFTGSTSNNWSNASNWDNGLPNSSTNATIPVAKSVIVDASANCKELLLETTASATINSGQSLNATSLYIKSDASATGSLINNGTLTISGNAVVERYMAASRWYMYASPVAGQTVSAFLTANTNIPLKSGNRGMMDYNTSSNAWNSYFTDGASNGSLTAGRGFSLRTDANGVVTTTGTVAAGDVNVATLVANQGWNLIGNPYASATALNSAALVTDNFVDNNLAKFATGYEAVYVWNEAVSTTSYSVVNNASAATYAQSGQGFFVKSNADQNFTFKGTSQSHQTTVALKSTNLEWSEIQLSASVDGKLSSTLVKFNENMTNGLDVTYDAGALKMANAVSIYTRLVNDNGVDFALQCLPNRNFDNMVIPVSIDCKAGGKVTFSAATLNLAAGCKAVLEDRIAKTFTDLTNGGIYEATVAAGTSGIGRFYLRTSDAVALSAAKTENNWVRAYSVGADICISGSVKAGAKATITDYVGRSIATFSLTEGNFNRLSPSLNKGVYLVTITSDGRSKVERIAIN